ncbi:MAG: hypothetical protein F6K41_35465 [Symploca sp. SIO3E6]|nr:hypothetical protein [Caldora sp. SIO3E6]
MGALKQHSGCKGILTGRHGDAGTRGRGEEELDVFLSDLAGGTPPVRRF